MNKQICSFDGCKSEVCEADKESRDLMHFCQEHHDQLQGYIMDGDAKKVLGFWVKSHGGAKKMAETF